jgi:hypothetical protein
MLLTVMGTLLPGATPGVVCDDHLERHLPSAGRQNACKASDVNDESETKMVHLLWSIRGRSQEAPRKTEFGPVFRAAGLPWELVRGAMSDRSEWGEPSGCATPGGPKTAPMPGSNRDDSGGLSLAVTFGKNACKCA